MTIDLSTLQPSAGTGAPPMSRRVLLYGLPKVGKSTTAVRFDSKTTLYVDLEKSTRDIGTPVFKVEPTSWAEFSEVVRGFAAGGHPFERIVIDTADKAIEYLDQEISTAAKVASMAEIEYGKGTNQMAARFKRAIGTLFDTDYGVWLISHAEKTENELGAVTVQPSLHKKVRGWATGQVDLILYASRFGTTSQLQATPGPSMTAGGRIQLPPGMKLDGAELRKAMEEAPVTPTAESIQTAPAPAASNDAAQS